MKAYIQILMQPVHERRNAGPLWMTWLLITLLIVAGIAVQVATGNIEMAGFAMSIPLAGLLILWWILFVKNALQQNAPTLALLVPALRGRLMRMTAVLWLAASLFGGCVAALVFGHFGGGLLATAAFTLVVAVGRRYIVVSALPGLLMIAANLIPHPSIKLWPLLVRIGEPAAAIAGFLLLTAIGAACLPLVFQRGGDRHWRWQARYAFRQDAIRTGGLSTSSASMWCGWGQILRVAYLASLKRDCAAATTPPPAQMQMYALGPDGHWMIYAGTPALMLVFAALGGWLLNPSAFVTSFAPVYVTFVVMIPLGVFVHNVNVAIYRTATEQGLLRLTPRVVPAAEFNRLFAGRLLATSSNCGWSAPSVRSRAAGRSAARPSTGASCCRSQPCSCPSPRCCCATTRPCANLTARPPRR